MPRTGQDAHAAPQPTQPLPRAPMPLLSARIMSVADDTCELRSVGLSRRRAPTARGRIRSMRPALLLVTPFLASANNGNWRTAARWARMLVPA